MQKYYLGLIDSRNAKYQGLVKDGQFNGVGILMDNLFTIILSTWKGHFINGPSVIVFPSLQMFFGQVQQSIPKSLVCFQVNQKQKYIINFQQTTNQSQQFIKSTITIAHIITNQSITHIQRQGQKEKYKIIQTHYCNKQDQGLKILSKIFKRQVLNEHVDLKLYLQAQFVQSEQYFQLSGRNELFFGFKNANTLGFKFENSTTTQVGNFSQFPRNLMFGRKVHPNLIFPSKTKIQEGNFQKPTKTFTFSKQNGSDIECQKLTQEYFKKSTNFQNKFTSMNHINKLYTQLKTIQKQVEQQTAKEPSHNLLQINNTTLNNNDQKQQVVNKEYTLPQVKEEIYRAAARKTGTFRRSCISPIKSLSERPVEGQCVDSVLFSTRSYLEQNRKIREYNFNPNANRQISRQILHNQHIFQERSRNFTYQNHYKSPNLIKQANQRLKAEQQYQKALLKQLAKEQQLQQNITSHQRPINLRIQPRQASACLNYQRNDVKRSPFILASDQLQRRINWQESIVRIYNWEGSQQKGSRRRSLEWQRQWQKSPGMINNLKRDRSVSGFKANYYALPREPLNEVQIPNDQQNQLPQQTEDKNHKHQTLQIRPQKQTPQNQSKNHKHIKETQRQQEHQQPNFYENRSYTPIDAFNLIDIERGCSGEHSISQNNNDRSGATLLYEGNVQFSIKEMEEHDLREDRRGQYHPKGSDYLESYSPFVMYRRANAETNNSEKRYTTLKKSKRIFRYVD